jgi:hypothetical protein
MRTGIDRQVGRALYELLTVAGQYPMVALPLARLGGYGVPIDRRTEVVIEGYPRSGTSFVVAAFRMAQGRPTGIAHHVHAPAQVLAAARRGIPAIVLIDEPERAVVELALARPNITVAGALRGYVRFYSPLVRDRSTFVVATTSQAMTELGSVIRRVNERFGTSFAEFRHTEETVRAAAEAAARDYEARRGSAPRPLGTAAGASQGDDPSRLREILREELEAPPLESARSRARSLFEAFAREAG